MARSVGKHGAVLGLARLSYANGVNSAKNKALYLWTEHRVLVHSIDVVLHLGGAGKQLSPPATSEEALQTRSCSNEDRRGKVAGPSSSAMSAPEA